MKKNILYVGIIITTLIVLIILISLLANKKSISDYVKSSESNELHSVGDGLVTRDDVTNDDVKYELSLVKQYTISNSIEGEFVIIDNRNPDSFLECSVEFYNIAKQCDRTYVIYGNGGNHYLCVVDGMVNHEYIRFD